MFLNSLNLFRAVAIFIIVAGHSYVLVKLSFDSTLEIAISNLLSGGTALFVFISGYLFHHVFYPRYQFSKFMLGKVKNVLVPYLILGSVAVSRRIMIDSDIANGFFLPSGEGVIDQILLPLVKYYSTGVFIEAYWYIPFIMLTFLMSPLHVRFIEWDGRTQLFIIVTFSVIAMLMHRPVDNLLMLQSVLYYLPIYLIGIACSINRQRLSVLLKGRAWYFLAMAIFLAFVQAQLPHFGNYVKSPLKVTTIDLMFLQKLALCLFFITWLERFDSSKNRLMETIAATSFAIFFFHPYLIWGLEKALEIRGWDATDSWSLYLVMVLGITALSIGLAIFVKRLLGKKSRYLIGY